MSKLDSPNGSEWEYDPTPCQNCGGRNVVGAATCWNCRAPLGEAPEASKPPPVTSASSGRAKLQTPAVARILCRHCGSANIEGAVLCWVCGKPLKEDSALPSISIPWRLAKRRHSPQVLTAAAEPETGLPPPPDQGSSEPTGPPLTRQTDLGPPAQAGPLTLSHAEKGAVTAVVLLLVGALLPWTQISLPFGDFGGGMGIDEAKASVVLAIVMASAVGVSLCARHLSGYLLALEAMCAVIACVLALRVWVRIDDAQATLAGLGGDQLELFRTLAESFRVAPDIGLYLALIGGVGALVTCLLRSPAPRAWLAAIVVPALVMIGSAAWPRSTEPDLNALFGNGTTDTAAGEPVARVTVESVDYLSAVGDPQSFMGGSRPQPGYRFARLLVVVTNVSDDTRHFGTGFGETWTAVDQNGYEFPSESMLTDSNDELDGTIGVPPGGGLRGAVYFEVPADSWVAKVRYEPESFNFLAPSPPPAEAVVPG